LGFGDFKHYFLSLVDGLFYVGLRRVPADEGDADTRLNPNLSC